jgi:COX Aromatic Rich Motif
MRFIAKAVPAGDFDAWVGQVRGSGSALDDAGYAQLAKPSKAVPPTAYRSVEPNLFEHIIDQTVSGSALPTPGRPPARAGVPGAPAHAGDGRVGADAGAAWCPPTQQAGG